MKKTVAILMILMVTAVCFSAYAGNPTNTRTNQYSNGNTDLEQELIQLPDFKFWNYDKNGIGYGNCPVYTAPYKDAYRCADGKASCQTNKQMSDAGIYGGWLLVRDDKQRRIPRRVHSAGIYQGLSVQDGEQEI